MPFLNPRINQQSFFLPVARKGKFEQSQTKNSQINSDNLEIPFISDLWKHSENSDQQIIRKLPT